MGPGRDWQGLQQHIHNSGWGLGFRVDHNLMQISHSFFGLGFRVQGSGLFIMYCRYHVHNVGSSLK